MPMSVAEVYMLALRKSMVPIVGEAVPHPFDFQIELDAWSWNLTPPEDDDKKEKGKAKDKDKSKAPQPKTAPGPDQNKLKKQDDDILKAINTIQQDKSLKEADKNRMVLEKVRKAQIERRKNVDEAGSDDGDDKEDGEDRKDRFTFTFEKNVDLASTQLLNAMKVGEVLPRIILTVIHRATHAPLTLIMTFKNVTLTDYKLNVDVSDTMADLKESWEARFEQVDYVYQNRPGQGGVPGLTQGTARVFKMNLKKLLS